MHQRNSQVSPGGNWGTKEQVWKSCKRALNVFTLPHPHPKTYLLGLLWSCFMQLNFFFKLRLVDTAAVSTELFTVLSTCSASLPDTQFIVWSFCPCDVNTRWKLSVHDRKRRGKHWSTHFKSCCLLSWQPVNKLCYSFFTSTWQQHFCKIWYY